MPGGVLPPPQLLAHLVYPQGEPRLQCVEEAGLPHPGVARKGGEPAGHQPPQLLHPFAGLGAGAYGGKTALAVDLRQRLPVRQIALIHAHHHAAVFQRRNGGDSVDEKGVRHRQGPGGYHHQLVHIGHRRPVKGRAAGQNLPHHALLRPGLLDLHPVPHQGAAALLAEFPPGPAGDGPLPCVHIVEAAEGLAYPAPTH